MTDAIQVKVTADIKSLKSTGWLNLKWKEIFYLLFSLFIVVLMMVFGTRVLHQEIVYFSTMIIMALGALPIAIERSGKFGITSEEFVINIIHFMIIKKKRAYIYMED